MDDTDRGQAIKARRLGYGIKSVRAFSAASGVSREAVSAAEDGEASPQTYERLEAWLDSWENETGGPDQNNTTDVGVVTFRLSGNFGVDVAVSGPVENLVELEATVARLIRGMGDQK